MTGGRSDDGAAGAWLELAVEADIEAVEAVSEILARVAPGGTSVEPAFELVDEGLGARDRPDAARDHSRLRAGARPGRRRRAVAEAAEALGHLQAFGLRPIGELRTRLVDEADWAEAWKAHFHVLRVGRRLVIKPTWRRHRREPDEVVIDLDPGMAFGTGLHPTTRLCLAGARGARGPRAAAGARVLDVGCGSGSWRSPRSGSGRRGCSASTSTRSRSRRPLANARHNRVGRRIRARDGSLPTGEGPFDLVLANLIAGVLVALAPDLADELVPAGSSSRRASSSTARPRSGRRSRRPGCVVDGAGPRATGSRSRRIGRA